MLPSPPAPDPTALNRPSGLTELFVAFTVLALQGFGGVMAVAHRELVERRRWLSNEAYLQEVALAQALPGPNVCNLAVMFGDRCFGWRGAAAALSGLMALPAVLLLAAVVLYTSWAGHALVEGALHGMGAVAAGTVAGTAFKLMAELRRHPLGTPATVAMAGLTFVALALLRWPIAPVILGLGGVGVSLTWWRLAHERRTP
ncbi:MAG: chromate transporter [Betaproteobacteria bacterium]|nr:chromate transporter [Betaproteobacteria bacterium]NBT10276.1 chromate transporter [Betaproteobacteria bacterium]